MAKHDTLKILGGFIATADSGRATVNSRVIAKIEPGAEEAAATIVEVFNSRSATSDYDVTALEIIKLCTRLAKYHDELSRDCNDWDAGHAFAYRRVAALMRRKLDLRSAVEPRVHASSPTQPTPDDSAHTRATKIGD